MDTVSIVALLNLAVGYLNLATVPFYCCLLYVLITRRQTLDSSFFTLFVSTGISDLFVIAHKTVVVCFPSSGFYTNVFSDNKLVAKLAHINIWFFYTAQVIGIALLTINRAFAMLRPFSYEDIWNPGYTKKIIILHWLLPVPVVIPMFFPTTSIHFINSTFFIQFDSPTIQHYYLIGDLLIELGVVAPCVVILYAAMVLKVWKHGNQVGNVQADNARLELRMAVVGGLLSVNYIVYVLCWAWMYATDDYFGWIVHVGDIAWYCLCMLNPYLLVLLCTTVRKTFLDVISCGRFGTNVVAPMPAGRKNTRGRPH